MKSAHHHSSFSSRRGVRRVLLLLVIMALFTFFVMYMTGRTGSISNGVILHAKQSSMFNPLQSNPLELRQEGINNDNNNGDGGAALMFNKKRPNTSKNGKSKSSGPINAVVAAVSPSSGNNAGDTAALQMQIERQQWELNFVKNILQRRSKILEETHDEMINAMQDLRAQLDAQALSLPPLAQGAGRENAPDLPCHCLEQSAMAPQDLWCDNRRKRISGAHVCVLRDVCFGDGETLLFLSPKASNSARQPRRLVIANVDQTGSVVYRPHAGEAGSEIFKKMVAAPTRNETVVLYASQFANHVTHVLEGAGGLHYSILRNEKRQRDGYECHPEDLTCFPPVGKFLFYGANFPGGWHENVLRIMIMDKEKSVKFNYQDSIASQPFQCYSKAIVPGFYYSVFPDSEDTSSFQESARVYLERNANWSYSPQRLGRILMSKRTSKRSVVDWNLLVDFVRSVASTFVTDTGKTIDVHEIEYGRESFEGQATKTAEADIVMGLHGADLTNMLFLRRGSVIMELNPLFFFENRFFELASNLGLHYMAWTCTNADCAFGGDRERFKNVVARFNYDHEKRVFVRGDGTHMRWPYDRYVGYSCPECDRLGFNVMDFRDTDVRVEKNLEEIRVVLERAFRNLGWHPKAA